MFELIETPTRPPQQSEQQLRGTVNQQQAARPVLATATSRKNNSLIQGFLESTERFPCRDALVVDNTNLSYRELRDRAGAIGQTILDQESDSFPLAGVLASRSATAYASVLGILGAGKGYVPLNPKFPVE